MILLEVCVIWCDGKHNTHPPFLPRYNPTSQVYKPLNCNQIYRKFYKTVSHCPYYKPRRMIHYPPSPYDDDNLAYTHIIFLPTPTSHVYKPLNCNKIYRKFYKTVSHCPYYKPWGRIQIAAMDDWYTIHPHCAIKWWKHNTHTQYSYMGVPTASYPILCYNPL